MEVYWNCAHAITTPAYLPGGSLAALACLRRIFHTVVAVAQPAFRAVPRNTGFLWVAAAVPAAFDDSGSEVGLYRCAVVADGGRADAHEVAEVVIEGVHLSYLPGRQ